MHFREPCIASFHEYERTMVSFHFSGQRDCASVGSLLSGPPPLSSGVERDDLVAGLSKEWCGGPQMKSWEARRLNESLAGESHMPR